MTSVRTFYDGSWRDGAPALMTPMTHGVWQGSSVFDGARAFEGVAPDLDRHCARVVASAEYFGLQPKLTPQQIAEIARDGVSRWSSDKALYIRPMFWAEDPGVGLVAPDPNSTKFCVVIHEAAMPAPNGISVTLASQRRPTPETAPTLAKAGCLYPNSARALQEVRARGFDNALVRDTNGYIAELATANIFMTKDGVCHTPAWNGSFLNGVTRQRVIALLRDAGVAVHERPLSYADFETADEIFSTGNYAKLMPITRIDNRPLQPGPVFQRARELYWAFAHNAL